MPFEMDSTISIHAPREGGDFWPAWVSGSICDFNPRPPRGGRQRKNDQSTRANIFQSTPPARGATPIVGLWLMLLIFQSTPPARGATNMLHKQYKDFSISIHAPREGGDLTTYCYAAWHTISIHAPREGGD